MIPRRVELDLSKLGMSDLAKGAGVVPGRFGLYARMVHGFRQTESEELEEMGDFGDRWEPLIAQAFVERLGLPAYIKPPTWYPSWAPWSRVSPDCFVPNSAGAPYLVECKLRNRFSYDAEGWEKQVPDKIRCQALGQLEWARRDPGYWTHAFRIDPMAIDEVHVAVCIDGQRLKSFRVPYDPEMGALLFEAAERFVRDYVEPRRWPPADTDEACDDYIRRTYPRAEGETIREATTAEQLILQDIHHLGLDIRELEEKRGALENQAKLAIGSNLGIRGHGLVAKYGNRVGSTQWKEVAIALAARHGEDLDALELAHKGGASRTLTVKEVRR